jgi:hypothetical protein
MNRQHEMLAVFLFDYHLMLCPRQNWIPAFLGDFDLGLSAMERGRTGTWLRMVHHHHDNSSQGENDNQQVYFQCAHALCPAMGIQIGLVQTHRNSGYMGKPFPQLNMGSYDLASIQSLLIG